jgi:ABC-type Fe3+ transport system permease subunit
MAEPYKQFDKDPIVDTSDVVIKGFRFRIKELAMGCAIIVCIIVIVILAALLASKNASDGGGGASTGAQVRHTSRIRLYCYVMFSVVQTIAVVICSAG